ncbi:MAG: hypothetical protein Q9166_004852 [cf. Caloplaca sp. 2 TL-2023]
MASESSRRSTKDLEDCIHEDLIFTSSPHAAVVGYKQPIYKPTAWKHKGNSKEAVVPYPAPLVLPGDELAFDPKYPPQSVRSWQRLKERNPVTRRGKVIYIATPPDVDPDIDIINSWTHPKVPIQPKQMGATATNINSSPLPPSTKETISYLIAPPPPKSLSAPAPLQTPSPLPPPPQLNLNDVTIDIPPSDA